MKAAAIIQARMGSSRLPGKSAKLLCGKPLVQHVLERVFKSSLIKQLILVIPEEKQDGVLLDVGSYMKVPTFIFDGNPNDVLHRYSVGARLAGEDIVVRIPGDNPCVDPDEIDRIIRVYNEDPPKWNYLTSNLDRDIYGNGYPGGLGAEVYDARFFYWMDRELTDSRYREHPHLWAFENQRVKTIQAPEDIRRPWLDFSVNTQADFDFIEDIYDAIYPTNPDFRTKDILEYLGRKNGECIDVESSSN